MKIKLFSCLALTSLIALSLVGCSSGDGVKGDESMEGVFKQAKKDGATFTPPPSKSAKKVDGAPPAANTP